MILFNFHHPRLTQTLVTHKPRWTINRKCTTKSSSMCAASIRSLRFQQHRNFFWRTQELLNGYSCFHLLIWYSEQHRIFSSECSICTQRKQAIKYSQIFVLDNIIGKGQNGTQFTIQTYDLLNYHSTFTYNIIQ